MSAHSRRFLSTPSARRATRLRRVYVLRLRHISIHALREEGDVPFFFGPVGIAVFLSTPSARRATYINQDTLPAPLISIHALREEGDLIDYTLNLTDNTFLSTPSARRATRDVAVDSALKPFLSTPSARRATPCRPASFAARNYFYPRPPRGGRPVIWRDPE